MTDFFSAVQISAFTALLLLVPGIAGTEPFQRGGDAPGFRHPGGRERPRFPMLRDMATSAPAGAFRHYMLQDLKQHVPLLHSRMQEAFRIQQERQHVQAEKHRAGQARSGRGGGDQFERFHQILEREEKLNRRMHELMDGAARDAGSMRQQVQKRRRELEQAVTRQAPAAGELTTETLFMRRASRVYEFMDSRLQRLEENPGQIEWMKPFLKGMFLIADGHDSEKAERLRQRMEQLQREQADLQRRMEQLQREIDLLGPAKDSEGVSPDPATPPHHRFRPGHSGPPPGGPDAQGRKYRPSGRSRPAPPAPHPGEGAPPPHPNPGAETTVPPDDLFL